MLRLRGSMVRLQMDPPTPDGAARMFREILTDDQCRKFENDRELDFGFEIEGVSRVRGNMFVQARGESAPCSASFPPRSREPRRPGAAAGAEGEGAHKERGLVLVTGPTGSGKSTTLAAIIDEANRIRKGPHHHDRGPGRVRPREQELHREPPGGRDAYQVLHGGPARRAARGPGHHPRR